MSFRNRLEVWLTPERPLSPITGEPREVLSLEPGQRRRVLTTSFVAHIAVLILSVILGVLLPTPPSLSSRADVPRLVFVFTPGPGGGGGGGGERLQTPPSVLKIEGKDRAELAVEVEKKPDESVKKDEPPPEDAVKAPVVAQAPDDSNEKGVLEGPEQVLPSAGSGAGGGSGTGSGKGIGEGDGSGIGPGWGGGFGGGAYQVGSGVTPPVLKRQVRPMYTEQALRKKIQGNVTLEIIILRDGSVGEVRVIRGLDAGLDVKAMEAVRQWLFLPGRFKGQPVDVLAQVQVAFTLL